LSHQQRVLSSETSAAGETAAAASEHSGIGSASGLIHLCQNCLQAPCQQRSCSVHPWCSISECKLLIKKQPWLHCSLFALGGSVPACAS
jgi:hypothetical protein